MVEFEATVTLLAAELARATGGSATVCLGCPLGPLAAPTLIALVPPPLERLPLDLAKVQLVVLDDGSRSMIDHCAAAGVVEVWILSAAEQAREDPRQGLERLTLPKGGSYRHRSLILPGDVLSLIALPQVTLTPWGP